MATTGHKTVEMYKKYVQNVQVYAEGSPNVSSIVLRRGKATAGRSQELAQKQEEATVCVLAKELALLEVATEMAAAEMSTVRTTVLRLQAEASVLEEDRAHALGAVSALEAQLEAMRMGHVADAQVTPAVSGAVTTPFIESRGQRSLSAVCHTQGSSVDAKALRCAQETLVGKYRTMTEGKVPLPKLLQEELCSIGCCCSLRDATAMKKRIEVQLARLGSALAAPSDVLTDAVGMDVCLLDASSLDASLLDGSELAHVLETLDNDGFVGETGNMCACTLFVKDLGGRSIVLPLEPFISIEEMSIEGVTAALVMRTNTNSY